MPLKYFVYEDYGTEHIVMFDSGLIHAEVAKALGVTKMILGAGMVKILNGRPECYGESISLGVESRPGDSAMMNGHIAGRNEEKG